MTNRKEAQQKLRDSLEISVIRRNAILYTLAIGVAVLMVSCQNSGSDDSTLGMVMAVGAALFLLPVWGFYLWRTICIFRKAENYIFCRCKLSQPHQNYFLQTMYFTVIIEHPDGSKGVRETHAIFPCHGLVGPLVEDYVNSTVTIGYNKETEMVVVIG